MEEMDMLFYVTLILAVLAAIVLAQFIIFSYKLWKIQVRVDRLIDQGDRHISKIAENSSISAMVHNMLQQLHNVPRKQDEALSRLNKLETNLITDNDDIEIKFNKPKEGEYIPTFTVLTPINTSMNINLNELITFIAGKGLLVSKLGDGHPTIQLHSNTKLPTNFTEAMKEYWQWANSPIETETV